MYPSPSPQRPSPPPSPLRTLVLPMLLVALLAVVLWQFIAPRFRGTLDPSAQPKPVVARGDLAADEKSYVDLFDAVSPSVVFITSIASRRERFSFNVLEIPRGTGSGFVWDDDGYIVTNFHVIQGGDTAQVTLWDQSTWRATIVGSEPNKDLAVLKIDAPKAKLREVMVGSARDLRVGQKVFAIGNPFGLDQTMTMGIIGGLDREIKSVTDRTIRGVIQTDAAINPGNSGGPLLDSAGRVIGVNTAIYSPSGAYAGVGFAVPVDTVNDIVPQLIRDGRVTRAGLGIMPARDSVLARRGVKGVLVWSVEPGGAAEKAGVRPCYRDEIGRIVLGDVIVAIDGQEIEDLESMRDLLEARKVGETVRLRVRRPGEVVEIDVTLQSLRG